MSDQMQQRIEQLSKAFPYLDEDALAALGEAAVEACYPTGSEICRQGEIGKTLFVLTQGEAEIYLQADENTEVRVNVARPGNYFGEMALLKDDTVRSATIRATTECRVLVIEQETFLSVADRNPALLRRLAVQLTDHLRNNDRAVITELRQKNEALQAAYSDLAQQEKMRGEFITTISHELRTPLTSIQGFLQLINHGMVKGDSLTIALESITRNVEKMVGMTNNLLVLYEMQLTSPEFIDITLPDLLVEAIRKASEVKAAVGSHVSIDISTNIPPSIRGDKPGLTLALHAIIENALKFSPQRTPVEIRVYPAANNKVCIDVIDHGIGIPDALQKRVFEPFFRTEHRPSSNEQLFDGVGIGLSIAKFIVERHNGSISIHSKEGEGTTFSISLPVN